MTRVLVVVPTHGRPDGVERALAGLADTAVPEGWTVRVCVVENGSSGARETVSRYGADYLHREQGNASAARNAGASRAPADVIVFLDDDVVPQPGWLARLVEPVLTDRADAAVGGVRLELGAPVPPAVRAAFVETALAMDPEQPFLIGLNMAVSPEAFRRAGGFEPELGPGALGGGEDLLLSLRLRQDGGRIAYVPEAEVVHEVPASRLPDAARLSRMAAAGRSDAWIVRHWFDRAPRLLRLRALRSRAQLRWVQLRGQSGDRERELTLRYWRERQLLVETGRPRRLGGRP